MTPLLVMCVLLTWTEYIDLITKIHKPYTLGEKHRFKHLAAKALSVLSFVCLLIYLLRQGSCYVAHTTLTTPGHQESSVSASQGIVIFISYLQSLKRIFYYSVNSEDEN